MRTRRYPATPRPAFATAARAPVRPKRARSLAPRAFSPPKTHARAAPDAQRFIHVNVRVFSLSLSRTLYFSKNARARVLRHAAVYIYRTTVYDVLLLFFFFHNIEHIGIRIYILRFFFFRATPRYLHSTNFAVRSRRRASSPHPSRRRHHHYHLTRRPHPFHESASPSPACNATAATAPVIHQPPRTHYANTRWATGGEELPVVARVTNNPNNFPYARRNTRFSKQRPSTPRQCCQANGSVGRCLRRQILLFHHAMVLNTSLS